MMEFPVHFKIYFIKKTTGKTFSSDPPYRIFSISTDGKKERIFVFSVKDRNLFHRVDTIGNIFTRGCEMK